MIGRLHHVIFDCDDPEALASFYSSMLGWPVTYRSVDFVVVAGAEDRSGLGFQWAPGHQRPRWPDPTYPQQVHLDVMVDDIEAAAAAVTTLGAVPLGGDHVYADPAGHPFCLIPRPQWADPITAGYPQPPDQAGAGRSTVEDQP